MRHQVQPNTIANESQLEREAEGWLSERNEGYTELKLLSTPIARGVMAAAFHRSKGGFWRLKNVLGYALIDIIEQSFHIAPDLVRLKG